MSRGQSIVAMPLSELLSIILVAVLVIGIGIFLVRAVFVSNSNAETASVYSMVSLAHSIKTLTSNPLPFQRSSTTVYIDSGMVLVGFPPGKQGVSYNIEEWNADVVTVTPTYLGTPELCGNTACLCLFSSLAEKPVSCVNMQGIGNFVTFSNTVNSELGGLYKPQVKELAETTFQGTCYPYSKDAFKKVPPLYPLDSTKGCGYTQKEPANQYASLVIFSNGNFKTQTLEIEKSILAGETNILVSLPLSPIIIGFRDSAFLDYAQTDLLKLGDDSFAQKDFTTAINLYSEYLAVAETNHWDDQVKIPIFEKVYFAHDGNARDEKANSASRIESLQYVLANYEQLIVRLPAYNYANTELAVLCVKSVPGDTACAGVPKLSATFNAVENGVCDGVVELERCTADPKTKLACVNNVWTKAPCGYDCQNSYTSDGKLQVLC